MVLRARFAVGADQAGSVATALAAVSADAGGVLLTALVFFNTYVWLMAATISGDRLGLAIAFLVSIAAAFVFC
jgi:ethanolamine transporter EutH